MEPEIPDDPEFLAERLGQWPPPVQCPVVAELLGGVIHVCELPAGHPMPHKSGETTWRPL